MTTSQFCNRTLNTDEAKILVSAQTWFNDSFPAAITKSRAGCLYRALAMITAANEHGHRWVPQAGTCYWPRLDEDQDDGTNPHLQFGYAWSPDDPRSKQATLNGYLPEIHVWAGDPATGMIIDPTTGFFPAQCQALLGRDWPGTRPPTVFWGGPDDLPARALYEPHRDACLLAADCMAHACTHFRC